MQNETVKKRARCRGKSKVVAYSCLEGCLNETPGEFWPCATFKNVREWPVAEVEEAER